MALLGAAWVSMWFFLNLYLQQILHYGPLESGLALLPMTALIMVMMVWASPKLMGRLETKPNMVMGLALLTVGILLFSLTPANSSGGNSGIFLTYVLPASIISALGMSFSYIPVLTSAVANAKKEDVGVASGLVNTTYQIGSALGLAIMVSIATMHSEALVNMGERSLDALNNGFHTAFIGAAFVSAVAAIVSLKYIKTKA
jgi:MFS family permease